MTSADSVVTRRPDGPLHRLGRTAAVWSFPDWAYAGEDGTFGNRFDDARGNFRVLYASSTRLGTFLETLARFRPDPQVLAAEIAADPRDSDYPSSVPGRVPASWLDGRSIGSATVDAAFADLGHSSTLAYLRDAMASTVLRFALDDLDTSSIRLQAPRGFTQEIASHLYDLADDGGERRLQGIEYASRVGDDIDNWAIWEPAEALQEEAEQPIAADDPDLRQAMARFGLTAGGS